METNGERRPYRWGFLQAVLVILALLCVGHAAGVALENFGPRDARGAGDYLAGLRAKDWLFAAFVVSGAVFVGLQRAAVARFFRSMHVGVSLISLTGLAILAGVLVPQIENFEDPTERVPSLDDIAQESVERYLAADKRAADEDPRLRPDDHPVLLGLPADQALRLKSWRREYEAFRWAEGYFLYHLSHMWPYGWIVNGSLPEGVLPPQVGESLARFGERYGEEERKNREIEMRAAFSGRLKTEAIRALITRHETGIRRAFSVCTALQLNRAYKSSWFATLLALLAVGVFLNTFRGTAERLLSLKKVGFVTVHLGVLTILAGGFVSKNLTDRGILHLDVTKGPTDTYSAYGRADKRTRMPFAVKADRFARKDWPTLEVGFTGDSFRSRLPEYTIWPGFSKELDFAAGEDGVVRPRIRLEVLRLAARAQVGMPRFYDAQSLDDAAGQGPLAELEVQSDSPDGKKTALLKPDYPERDSLEDPAWKFRLRSSYGAPANGGDGPDGLLRDVHAADPSVLGSLLVRTASAGQVEPERVPFRLGQKLAVAGGFTVEVTEATGSFQLDPAGTVEVKDPRPLAEQYPRSPAVWVSITGKEGGEPERRLLLEALDWEALGRQQKFQNKDLVLGLEWERWTSAGPPRFVLHWGPDGTASLLSEDGAETKVAPGGALPLPGPTKVVAKALHRNVLYEKQIELVADPLRGPHFDPDFYSRDPAGLELAVTSWPGTPRERRDVVRMATTDESLADFWTDPEQRFSVRFYGNSRALPFEWRSVLSIWKKDADGRLYKEDLGPEEAREVRVNDYLFHGGYRLFQTNAIAELPNYSGIGVVYDPGIPVVLMGMYLTIVGTVLAFIVRPIVASVRERRQAGALSSKGSSGAGGAA